MHFLSILLPAIVLVTEAAAGPVTLAAGAVGCTAACGTACASCHIAGHSASVFTLGISSWLDFAGCH